jgi:hypothetical protein
MQAPLRVWPGISLRQYRGALVTWDHFSKIFGGIAVTHFGASPTKSCPPRPPRRFLQDRPRRRVALDAVLALVLQDVVASESRSHVTAAESPQTTAGDCRSRFAYGVFTNALIALPR